MPPPYVNKWASLAASLACLLTSGLAYAFSLYADDLKRHFGFDQEQISTVSAWMNAGSYFGLPAGWAYDGLRSYPRLGPRLCLVAGASIMCCGYLALWAAATGPAGSASLPAVAAAAFVAANGATWLDAAALATAVRNHGRHRGLAVGVLKGAVGLSGSVFSTLFLASYARDSPRFLLLLALAPPCIVLPASLFVNAVPFDQRDEWPDAGALLAPSARFSAAAAVLAALAVYQMGTALVLSGPGAAALSRPARWVLVGGLAAVASGLLAVPAGSGGLWAVPAEEDGSEGAGDGESGAGDDPAAPLLPPSSPSPPLPVLTPRQCLTSIKFGLLFFIVTVGGGCGLAFINSAGAVAAALDAPAGAALLVSAFSVANCAGRLAFGAASEAALHSRWRVPRPAWFGVAAALAGAGAAAVAAAPRASLPAVAALCGFSFGGHWSLMATVVAVRRGGRRGSEGGARAPPSPPPPSTTPPQELGGLDSYASNYALLQLAPAAGSFGLARSLVGTLYDREATKQGTPGYCHGPACFRVAFSVCAGLAAASCAAEGALTALSRGSYARLAAALAAADADRDALVAVSRRAGDAARRTMSLDGGARRGGGAARG